MATPRALDVSSYRIIPQSGKLFDIVLRFAEGNKLGELTYRTHDIDRSAIPKKIIGFWSETGDSKSYNFVCIDPKYRTH